jgi:hypothetical protein
MASITSRSGFSAAQPPRRLARTGLARRWRLATRSCCMGVTRAFGALRAVDDVSFAVAAGSEVRRPRIQRRGQDNLFNAITGDFPPTAGRILNFLARTSRRCRRTSASARGLRRTYQSSLLFRDLSVRDNLFLAVRGVASGRFGIWRAFGGAMPRSRATEDLLRARAPGRISPTSWWATSRTASSASSRSAWRWPAHRADPLRRAGCRAVARGAARTRGAAAHVAAGAHELRASSSTTWTSR